MGRQPRRAAVTAAAKTGPEEIDQDADENALIGLLTGNDFNGQGNNGTLIKSLRWDANRYWSIRNRLLDKGVVSKAPGGPGGKTILIQEQFKVGGKAAAEAAKPLKEDELYKPLASEIEKNWVKEKGYDQSLVRICARLGRRSTGGKWSRPDICLVGVQKFKLVREPVFDLISFEVKTADAVTVEGVFEALSHRQAINRAYAIYSISESTFWDIEESERIRALGERHGVGVILAEDPADQFSWVEIVRAERWDPDPSNLNDFIEQIFEKKDHDEIIKMVR